MAGSCGAPAGAAAGGPLRSGGLVTVIGACAAVLVLVPVWQLLIRPAARSLRHLPRCSGVPAARPDAVRRCRGWCAAFRVDVRLPRSRSAGCWLLALLGQAAAQPCGWCCRWRRSLLAAGCWLLGLRTLRAALVLLASCTLTGLQVGSLNPLLFVGLALFRRLRARPRAAAGVAALLVVAKLFLFPVLVGLLLARRRTGLVAAG